MTFETKDSGARAEYDSGMVRDVEEGKARFDLLLPLGIPYAEQMLTRDAMLMERGRKKYGARNWENAKGEAELARYYSSAHRHLMQWIAGETDEDHAAAVRFNVMAGEFVKRKLAATEAIAIATAPDANCITLGNGDCVGGPCMHDPIQHPLAPAVTPARDFRPEPMPKFLCGHSFGEAPVTNPAEGPVCGSLVHWSRVNGIEER